MDQDVLLAFVDYWKALKPEYQVSIEAMLSAYESGYWEGYADSMADESEKNC